LAFGRLVLDDLGRLMEGWVPSLFPFGGGLGVLLSQGWRYSLCSGGRRIVSGSTNS
jgi:hypothetical protein